MALSDEDYGILYNAIEQTPHNGTSFELCRRKNEIQYIISKYVDGGLGALMQFKHASLQYLLDFASFIILSEGRELP